MTYCRFIDQEQQIQGFEQLLRRLLLLPHQPAVVVVHWWSPVHDCIVDEQVGKFHNDTLPVYISHLSIPTHPNMELLAWILLQPQCSTPYSIPYSIGAAYPHLCVSPFLALFELSWPHCWHDICPGLCYINLCNPAMPACQDML